VGTRFLGIGGQVVVTQYPPEITEFEGQNVTLNCSYSTKVTAFWYMQNPDGALQYLYSSGNDDPVKGAGFGNRFSAQVQKSNSTTSLSVSELVVSDSAVYYCAFSLTTVIDCTASLVQKLPSPCITLYDPPLFTQQ
uniref:Ig-like domain-containing protein n=1 Tax=Callorhinchus milii TaxID=7868 RepID=A0A4W3IY66_CALMI